MRDVGREQGRSQQRTDDQARSLHREDQRDQHAAMRLTRILAHDRNGDRIVAADPDAEDKRKPMSHQMFGEKAQAMAPAARTRTSTPQMRLRPTISAMRPKQRSNGSRKQSG